MAAAEDVVVAAARRAAPVVLADLLLAIPTFAVALLAVLLISAVALRRVSMAVDLADLHPTARRWDVASMVVVAQMVEVLAARHPVASRQVDHPLAVHHRLVLPAAALAAAGKPIHWSVSTIPPSHYAADCWLCRACVPGIWRTCAPSPMNGSTGRTWGRSSISTWP